MTTPPSRPPRSWNGEELGRRSARDGAAAARRGRREGVPVRPVAPEDVRPSEAETMIPPLTPDEALVVDIARGLDSGSMIDHAHRVLMQEPYSVFPWPAHVSNMCRCSPTVLHRVSKSGELRGYVFLPKEDAADVVRGRESKRARKMVRWKAGQAGEEVALFKYASYCPIKEGEKRGAEKAI